MLCNPILMLLVDFVQLLVCEVVLHEEAGCDERTTCRGFITCVVWWGFHDM